MGAEVVAWDDNPARDARAARRRACALRDPAQTGDFALSTRWCCRPAFRIACRQPHPVARARDRGRRADPVGRRTAVPGGARVRLARPLRRHHRHQRQIHHHRAAGAHPGAAPACPSRRAAISARRRCRCRCCGDDGVYVLEMSSYMLERLATLRFDAAAMLNLSADHSIATATWPATPRPSARSSTGRRRGDLAVVGVDDAESRAMAAWLRAQPARWLRSRASASRRCLRATTACCATRPADRGMAAAPALPGAHNAQNAAAADGDGVGSSACPTTMIAPASRRFPGLPHRQQRIAHDRRHRPSSTTARRPTPTPRRARWPATTGWSGSPAAWRKRAGSSRWRRSSRASPRALLIGRDAPMLAATLAAHGVPHEIVGTLDAAVPAAFAAARATGAPGRAAVAGLRQLGPVQRLRRSAATVSPRSCAALCTGRAA